MSEAPAPVDSKPQIEEKCKVEKCAKWAKAYDECAERVSGGHVHHEGANCSGQMFDLYRCIDACAAPQIFAKLR